MKVKAFWNDGTESILYWDFNESQIDTLWEQMKRKPNKRLYRFGVRLDLIKSIEVIE